MPAPDVARQTGAHSTAGALERGQVGHLLDRRDECLEPFHVPIVADLVARYAVNGGGGVMKRGGSRNMAQCRTLA